MWHSVAIWPSGKPNNLFFLRTSLFNLHLPSFVSIFFTSSLPMFQLVTSMCLSAFPNDFATPVFDYIVSNPLQQ